MTKQLCGVSGVVPFILFFSLCARAQDPAVVRTAPFTGGTGYGCSEDTSTGEVLFAEMNYPFVVEFRTKDLQLVRTINLPTPAVTMTGIAYDPKNDTIWAGENASTIISEYDKNTGLPTGGSIPYVGGWVPGPLSIDIHDGNGGDTIYIGETWLDTIDQVDLRTGTQICQFNNPNGQPVAGTGVSYAANPRFPGEVFVSTGPAGAVTHLYRGNPCLGTELGDPLYIENIAASGDVMPWGFHSSIDPSALPTEVFYFVGNQTGTIYEINFPATVDQCQGADDEDVLFVNGQNSPRVSIVEGWPLHFGIWKPSGGGNGRFLVHMNPGHPTDLTITTLPYDLGSMCFPVLIPPFGSASPVSIWNNVGKTSRVGASNYFGATIPDPPSAPTFFLDQVMGDVTNMPAGSLFTLQGVVLNPAAASPKGGSVTNGIAITLLAQP